MVRQRLLGSVRFTLVIALLGALFIATAGVVSAAAAITFTPGAGGILISGSSNSWAIPFTSATATVNVDCGSATGACSVWATKNNRTTETLFTNVTGNRANIPFPFVNDGCINLRLYDAGHTQLLGQVNVGHGIQDPSDHGAFGACDAAGAGRPIVIYDGVNGFSRYGMTSGIVAAPPAITKKIQFDSGNAGGADEAEVWISQSKPGFAFTSCTAISFPNASEVLLTRNASGEIGTLTLTGGGPYCFTLYQGSSHTTKIAGPVEAGIGAYLQYVGGTAQNPTPQGTVYYSSGNGATNALVCIGGTATNFSTIPFTFNSLGFGSAVASFQTASGGSNNNGYFLFVGVGALDANGNATKASCNTGTAAASIASVKT